MSSSDLALINPVELPDCEFDAKLPLSRVAAEAGLRAVFGSQTSIHTNIERRRRIIRDLGDSIIGWDEDGLARYPSTQYRKLRIEPHALEQIALWFAWGDDDAALPKAHPALQRDAGSHHRQPQDGDPAARQAGDTSHVITIDT